MEFNLKPNTTEVLLRFYLAGFVAPCDSQVGPILATIACEIASYWLCLACTKSDGCAGDQSA